MSNINSSLRHIDIAQLDWMESKGTTEGQRTGFLLNGYPGVQLTPDPLDGAARFVATIRGLSVSAPISSFVEARSFGHDMYRKLLKEHTECRAVLLSLEEETKLGIEGGRRAEAHPYSRVAFDLITAEDEAAIARQVAIHNNPATRSARLH